MVKGHSIFLLKHFRHSCIVIDFICLNKSFHALLLHAIGTETDYCFNPKKFFSNTLLEGVGVTWHES